MSHPVNTHRFKAQYGARHFNATLKGEYLYNQLFYVIYFLLIEITL